jgi:hypothetical protein
MKPNPTQCELILSHLIENKSITPIDALNLYGCFRLAARIHELKQAGHKIDAKPWTTPGGAIVSKYFLVGQL